MQLRLRLVSLGIHERIALGREAKKAAGEKHLYNSLRAGLKRRAGQIDSLSIGFVRHGIFVERGAGQNRPAGSPAANAAAKPWLSYVLNPQHIGTLADIIAKHAADDLAYTLRIYVPGILDTQITSSTR